MVQKGVIPPDAESVARVERLRGLRKGARVHVSGICGTGVSAVAVLLKTLGYQISGSDKAFYPPMGDLARSITEKLFTGYDASHIEADVEFLIIGNNLRRDNPEVLAANERNIPFASMPEAFAALLIQTRDVVPTSIVVSGTHGKSTTSAAIATLLDRCGRAPGYFVGGLPNDLPGNIRAVDLSIPVEQRCVVLEGDEYDSAFFAKWSKFHSYRPDVAVVTSLEFDHADIFNDIHDIEREFDLFVEKVPSTGLVLVCDVFPALVDRAREWQRTLKAPVMFYGTAPTSEFRLLARSIEKFGGATVQKIRMSLRGSEVEICSPLTGEHNAWNLLATAAVGQWVKLDNTAIANAIAQFHGVLRRQNVIYDRNGITIVEDFAHHPTAIGVTLAGLKEAFPDRRLVGVFEPRSNTSKRSFFQTEYPQSFAAADLTVLQRVQDASGYSNTQSEIVALDVDRVLADIRARGKSAEAFSSAEEIASYLVETCQPGDLICCMSNGDFGGLLGMLKEGFGRAPA